MGLESVHHRPFHLNLSGFAEFAADGWAGFASMLVALPSGVAYGVAIYSIVGPQFAAQGAIAGIIGAAALGLIAPVLGGAPRLISAPCGPAFATMAAIAAELALIAGKTMPPQQILVLLAVVAFSAGVLQLFYGLIGAGRLIKYIPYPVISGYLSAVGFTILLSQLPQLFGLSKGVSLWVGVFTPSLWQWPNLVIGAVTIAAFLAAPKILRALPAPILGLAGGMAAYFVLAQLSPEYFALNKSRMVIGAVTGGFSTIYSAIGQRWLGVAKLNISTLTPLLVQPLTLSILLSIDTLKTCVLVDTLTQSRHNSNRVLIGQGLANSVSALLGGIPGGGVSGATLVNVNSGAKTKWSGFIEGLFVVAAFLLFGRAIGQTPIAALAGILAVIGVRMVDRNSVELLRQKSTAFDFLVIAAVVGVALRFDLITAAGAGLGLSILFFIREQIRGSVIRRKLHLNQISSKKQRLPAEKELLRSNGMLATVCQLQGTLFFGTTDQLLQELDADLQQTRYVILDMTRVQSVDFTAVHMLEQVEARLTKGGGHLVFASLPPSLPTGQDLQKYFEELELLAPTNPVKVFDNLDDALEWVEDCILDELHFHVPQDDRPLDLQEIDLLKRMDAESIAMLRNCAMARSYTAGQRIFDMGSLGDELYLIRKGIVRISLPFHDGRRFNVTTFGRGDFFGDMAFLDRGARSADATAITPTELYAISRSRFDELARLNPQIGANVFTDLARALAVRLRFADAELRALQES